MKKKIAAILVVFLLAGSGAWAVDDMMVYSGGALLGVGGTLCLLPVVMESDSETAIWAYIGGGAVALGGLILILVGANDDSTSSSSYSFGGNTGKFSKQGKTNPILKHLTFGVVPNKVFIGSSFKF